MKNSEKKQIEKQKSREKKQIEQKKNKERQQIEKNEQENGMAKNQINQNKKIISEQKKEKNSSKPGKLQPDWRFELSKMDEKSLIELLSRNLIFPKLGEVNLYGSKITNAGVIQLAKFLDRMPNLQKLKLDRNQITDEGVIELAFNAYKMPNLQEIYLGNNQIKDKGLIALVKYADRIPNLQKLSLDDNYITERGLVVLVQNSHKMPNLQKVSLSNNKITEAVVKKLIIEFKIKFKIQIETISSHQSKLNDQKYQDQNLKIYKQVAIQKTKAGKQKIKVKPKVQIFSKQQKNGQNDSSFTFKDIKTQKIWQQIQNIEKKSQEISHLICDELMNQPPSEVQLKKSETIKKSLQQKASLNPESVQNIITKLTEKLQEGGIPVIMNEHSTVKSQISLKILTEGFMQDAAKFTEIIPDNDPSCPFSFDDLKNTKTFTEFCRFYQLKLSKQTGLSPDNIFINCVTKGSLIVNGSINDGSKLRSALKQNPGLQKRLKVQKYFQQFNLSPQDFDRRGDIVFEQQKSDVQTRGGWPYYQPIKCKRYGLNVSKKYDNGNDTWLKMYNVPGQWAVAFHGVRNPRSFCSDGKTKVLNSIMKGLNAGDMLIAGSNQVYSNDRPKNYKDPREKVGQGIYCSPHIQVAFDYTNEEKHEYGLIFQCRVNPNAIKVCSNDVYWVINDSINIRPYGIILIKQEIIDRYPKAIEQFGQEFAYKRPQEKAQGK